MERQVTLTIDGREVTVPENTTVLDAAGQAGIHIPHLCHCPGLEDTGACRLCLVEVDGNARPVVSCRCTVRPGMQVRTQTEELRAIRRFIIELLLSRHPGDCLACDKSGECLLQRYAYELGASRETFPQHNPDHAAKSDDPLIVRDSSLCILCGRCVRVCQKYGAGVLDYARRGLATVVSTPFGKPLAAAGCDFCGSCVEVCPTGALLERPRRGQGRIWEFQKKAGVCMHCGLGCQVCLDTRSGRIVRARTSAVGGYLCVRGRFGWSYLHSPERLTTPLVRKDGRLVPAGWDEALTVTATKLGEIARRHGRGAVGGIVGAMVSSEEAASFCRLIRDHLGGEYVDSILRFAGLSALGEIMRLLGGNGCATLEDVAGAGVILVIGDVVDRVPGLWPRVKEALKRGATIIALDFRQSRVARAANIWLRCRPGKEAALLGQILAWIVRKGEGGRQVPANACRDAGLERVLRAVEAERVDTGVREGAVREAAAVLGDPAAKAVIAFAVDGLAPEAAQAALYLAAATGRVPGGVFSGAGVPNLRALFQAGAFAAADDGLYGDESPLRALYVLGEDPLSTFPCTEQVQARLAGLDFLVVQDLFLTPTAALADVVLPGTVPVETGGSMVSADGTIREFEPAVPPPVIPAAELLARLAGRLGVAAGSTACTNRGARRSQSHKSTAPVSVIQEAAHPLLLVPSASPYRIYRDILSEKAGLHTVDPYSGHLRMAPEDAAALGIAPAGGTVTVRTPSATLQVRAVPDNTLPPGVVSLPAFSRAFNTLTAPGQTAVPVTVTVDTREGGDVT